jgi:hypothetical protein
LQIIFKATRGFAGTWYDGARLSINIF